jgi:hypothetical protein
VKNSLFLKNSKKIDLVVVVVVNAVNELELIKHYIRKYSAMTASG